MILQWLSSFPKFDGRWGIKLGLERMEALLEKLGNPHRRLRFIHIAGTNGKGSTCAYLASIYLASGYKVGRYTSPYIMHFFDRMSVNGKDVTEAQLDRYAEKLIPLIDEIRDTEIGEPTEFEVITLLAILYFLDEQVDLVIWETGLGGRLDATNVVTPLASLITNVGMDHMAHLGSTIEAIAYEKAGIIKPEIPVFTGAEGAALRVIEQHAAEVPAPCWVLNRDFSYNRSQFDLSGQVFDFQSANIEMKDLEISMLGEHQCKNASLAVKTALFLAKKGEIPLTEESLREGLQQTRWPGRLEIIQQSPLVILDGAHNPHGSKALANAIGELSGNRNILLVTGILQDKLVPGVLDPILPFAHKIIVTAPKTPRAAHVDEEEAFIRDRVSVPVKKIPNVSEAVQYAIDMAQPDEIVLVTGSLYTISEARIYLQERMTF